MSRLDDVIRVREDVADKSVEMEKAVDAVLGSVNAEPEVLGNCEIDGKSTKLVRGLSQDVRAPE